MAIDMKKIEDDFQTYLMFIEDNLIDLETVLKEYYGENYELSYNEDSILKIETFLGEQLDNYTITLFPKGKLLENISTYMGEIIKRKFSGHWDFERDEDMLTFGFPVVTGLKGLDKDFGWVPIHNIFAFEETRKEGLLLKGLRAILYANDPSKW